MLEIIKSEEELLTEKKQVLFDADIEGSKERQRRIIAQADNEIAYSQGQISIQESRKQSAQNLLDELEARYPSPIPLEA